MMRAQVCCFGRLNRSAELWQHPPRTRIDDHTTRFELHFVKIGQQIREHGHTRRDDGDEIHTRGALVSMRIEKGIVRLNNCLNWVGLVGFILFLPIHPHTHTRQAEPPAPLFMARVILCGRCDCVRSVCVRSGYACYVCDCYGIYLYQPSNLPTVQPYSS